MMNPVVEIELKAMLTENEFRQLLHYFGKEQTEPIVQQNTYYETSTQTLKKHHAALRLRNFSDTSEWTIKQSRSEVASLELNQYQPFAYSEIPDTPTIHAAELLTFLDEHQIPLKALRPTLTLTTKRWIIPAEKGEFCLDQTTYFGVTDYEIELETTHLGWARSTFQALLAKHHIPYRHADKKIARALQKQP